MPEIVTDRPERFVRIEVDRDELAVTWSRYGPGQSGPGPHVHHEHVDAFEVLGGELVFRVGPDLEAVTAPAGTFVAVPPGVVHTFANESDTDATFLNVHAPSMNFAAHLRGEDVDFDTDDPPADGGRPACEVVVSGARG